MPSERAEGNLDIPEKSSFGCRLRCLLLVVRQLARRNAPFAPFERVRFSDGRNADKSLTSRDPIPDERDRFNRWSVARACNM